MKKLLIVAAMPFLLLACKKETASTTQTMSLSVKNLTDLGATAQYEGWIVVNGVPVSTGTFKVSSTGVLSQTSFVVNKVQLAAATAFVVTIEPIPDASPAPTSTHLLGGTFTLNNAPLTIDHAAALNTNFSTATGKYLLATPTTTTTTDELSGLWFINNSSGSGVAGLSLPTLPAGWKYEGWALINGVPVSTGTFLNVAAADDAAPFSGTAAKPPFPGEDFLFNAPTGLTFPTNLSGGLAVVSVEPSPDNSPAPFLLKPLIGSIPKPATDHVTYNMTLNTANFPSGSVSR